MKPPNSPSEPSLIRLQIWLSDVLIFQVEDQVPSNREPLAFAVSGRNPFFRFRTTSIVDIPTVRKATEYFMNWSDRDMATRLTLDVPAIENREISIPVEINEMQPTEKPAANSLVLEVSHNL